MAIKEVRNQLLKNLFEKYQRLIFIIATLIVLALGYLLVLQKPATDYRQNLALWNKLNGDISQANSELAKAASYSNQIYQPTTREQKLFNMALPEAADPSSIIEHLTSLAKKAGFTVNSIDIETVSARGANVASADNIGKTAVDLKLSGGGYTELKTLVKLLEDSIMMIDISAIDFSSKSPIYDVSLIVYNYRTNPL